VPPPRGLTAAAPLFFRAPPRARARARARSRALARARSTRVGAKMSAPEELPVGATPVFEGFLHKQSEWIRDWRRRYFKLFISAGGPRLYFSKDAAAPPHGMVDLRGCLTVKSADEKTGKANSFEVATKEKVFFMYAESNAEKDEVRSASRARAGASKRRRLTPAAAAPRPSPRAVGRPARARNRAREPQLPGARGRRRRG